MQIKAWEEEELGKPISMEEIRIDPSPFQLVERTSLHKVSTVASTLCYYVATLSHYKHYML
jgi:hypothetical protein